MCSDRRQQVAASPSPEQLTGGAVSTLGWGAKKLGSNRLRVSVNSMGSADDAVACARNLVPGDRFAMLIREPGSGS